MSLSDAELVGEARVGSRAAFATLMERHERLVYRICYSYTRHRDDALDVTQDVFVKVFTRLASFRAEGPFKAWLVRVTHRECLNWRRRHQHEKQREEFTSHHASPSVAEQEIDIQREQIRTLLETALGTLNAKQRLAVTLRYFGQQHLHEIAAVLGCSEGNVKSLLFRSLRKLRDQMAPQTKD